MSLLGSLQLAAGGLNASQIGLQVVGQNIANANTPGYIREQVILTPQSTQRQGNLLLGLGVRVTAIVQKIDTFLEERLRGATSERVGAERQEDTYLQLESLLGELGENDLSTALNNFFNSISEVLNQPESVSVRNLAVLQGKTLTGDISRLARRVITIAEDTNDRVISLADDVNRLTREIRDLNLRIADVEGGDVSRSDAVGLRDQRQLALTKLSELIDVQVKEQRSGGVAVFSGGEFLVFEGQQRDVKVHQQVVDGLPKAEIQFAVTESPIQTSGGELAGLLASRDEILRGFLDDLNQFTETLAFEFNKVFASGQGLNGYSQIVSERSIADSTAPLDEAGLPFTPVNGSFDILLRNNQTGITETTTVRVDLNGLDEDTSLGDLAAKLEAIDGITASVTATGELDIRTNSTETEFAFAADTSGVLAALGVNTFFSGTDALSVGVNDQIADDPAKFAASAGGLGEDTEIGVELAGFLDKPLETQNNASLSTLYDGVVSRVVQGSSVTRAAADGFRVFEQALEGQKLATSGVNLDEEAVRMIQFQRAFQASARFIATVNELLQILTNI